jgi:cytochrome c-type biogenesis protein CcmE
MALSVPAKIGLGATLTAALAYLVFSDPGQGVLEKANTDEVVAAPETFQGREIQVYGVVVAGSVQQKKGSSADYRFTIEHNGQRLDVHYTDMVPDTFREGGHVEMIGRLNERGDLLESHQMNAQCPSKYQEEAGALPPRT